MSVYFLRVGEAGPVKIGYSQDPYARRGSLQSSHSEKVNLIAFIEGDRSTEKAIQGQFIHLKIRGDWFNPGPDLLAFVAGLPPMPKRIRAVKVPFAQKLAAAKAGDTLTYKSPLEVAGSFYSFVHIVSSSCKQGIMIVREGCENIKSDGHDLLMMLFEDGAIYD